MEHTALTSGNRGLTVRDCGSNRQQYIQMLPYLQRGTAVLATELLKEDPAKRKEFYSSCMHCAVRETVCVEIPH
jgi:hypothetical protein